MPQGTKRSGGVESSNAERQRKKRLATAEPEILEAKSTARRTRKKIFDPQEKGTKATRSKGQSK